MVLLLLSLSLIIFLFSSYIAITYKGYGYLPVFFSSYFIFILIIPAYFHVINNIFPFYSMSYGFDEQLYAAFILFIFSIFFWFGFFIKKSKISKKYFFSDKEVNQFRFFLVLSISFIFLLASILSFGIDSFMVKRGDFDREIFGQDSSIRELFLSSIKALSFACLFYLIIYRKKLNNYIYWVYFFVACVLFFIINFPLSLPRFILFSYVIAIFCYYFKPTLRNKLNVLLAFAIGITTLFPYMSHITRGEGDFQLDLFKYYQSSGDFDGFQSIINTVIYVNTYGFSYGNQIISSILSFIPRSIWASKADPTGSVAASAAGYEYVNISAPLPAEFFIDFGFIGLICISFLFGFILRSFDQRILEGFNSHLKYIMSIIILSLIVIISRGSLLAIINTVYAEIFIFIFIYYLIFLKIKLN